MISERRIKKVPIIEDIYFLKKTINKIPLNKYKFNIGSLFFTAVALIIPSILAGLRDFSIGTDVLVYGNKWFNITELVSFPEYMKWATKSNIGFFYALLNEVVSWFTNDVHWFYFFLTLLTNLFVYVALSSFRGKISVPFSMLVYYCLFFNSSLNILRQSIAISAMIIAIKYLSEENIKNFFVFLIVACLFHSSSIIMIVLLPIYIISKKRNNLLNSILIVSVSTFVLLIYSYILKLFIKIGVLSSRYLSYSETSEIIGGRIIRASFYGIVFLLLIITYKSLLHYDKRNAFLINCSLLTFVFSMLLFLGNNQVIRIAFYFDITLTITLPMIAENFYLKFGENKKIKILYPCLIALVVFYWFLNIVVKNNGETYPYIIGI